MKFEVFIKQKKVIQGAPDLQKSKSLVKMAKSNLEIVKQIPKTDNSASVILSQSYESLRQILEAIALTKGLKVYSHEAFTYFLLDLGEVSISEHFDRLRKLRNGVNYYGSPVSLVIANSSLEKIEEIMLVLIEKYLEQIFN